MRSKAKYIVFAVLVLLIVTNPSQKDFKEHLGASEYVCLKRTYNFFICSIYQRHNISYFGAIDNFWQLNKPQVITLTKFQKDSIGKSLIDSMNSIDSSSRHHPYYVSDTTKDGLPIIKQR